VIELSSYVRATLSQMVTSSFTGARREAGASRSCCRLHLNVEPREGCLVGLSLNSALSIFWSGDGGVNWRVTAK
jgi:hypothetical protein